MPNPRSFFISPLSSPNSLLAIEAIDGNCRSDDLFGLNECKTIIVHIQIKIIAPFQSHQQR